MKSLSGRGVEGETCSESRHEFDGPHTLNTLAAILVPELRQAPCLHLPRLLSPVCVCQLHRSTDILTTFAQLVLLRRGPDAMSSMRIPPLSSPIHRLWKIPTLSVCRVNVGGPCSTMQIHQTHLGTLIFFFFGDTGLRRESVKRTPVSIRYGSSHQQDLPNRTTVICANSARWPEHTRETLRKRTKKNKMWEQEGRGTRLAGREARADRRKSGHRLGIHRKANKLSGHQKSTETNPSCNADLAGCGSETEWANLKVGCGNLVSNTE